MIKEAYRELEKYREFETTFDPDNGIGREGTNNDDWDRYGVVEKEDAGR